MTTFAHNQQGHTRSAFSLIEVLVAIIVLALGLLGLGALFPAVIRQQRIATDQTLGVLAAEAARTTLTSGVFTANKRLSENQFIGVTPQNGIQTLAVQWDPMSAWIALANSPRIVNDFGNANKQYENGGWYVNTVCTDDVLPARGLSRGAARIGNPLDPQGERPIALAERLYPREADRPLFVWDFAVQFDPARFQEYIDNRSNGNVSDPERLRIDSVWRVDPPLRAAIFVRRIDPRVRAARNATLRSTLLGLGGVVGGDQRSPLGIDATGNPTSDGTDGNGGYGYALLRTSPAKFIVTNDELYDGTAKRDRLYIPPSASAQANDFDLLRLPGQRIVDNLGNIYNVVGDGEDSALGRYLKIDPPVPPTIIASNASSIVNGNPQADDSIRQIVFSPQPPVTVLLVEIRR
jgi:prepilin-type N-terminal cleavage/methylation domain-containing protein